MNRLRAVLRRLDAWAALVLGFLVALGVIILLATPGPWHVVVDSTPQIPLVAPPPSDVAVFVNGTSAPGRCTGVLWLHLDYEDPSLACVVVPAELDGRLPEAGFAPLESVVRDAGPAEASQALGKVLGVEMGAWMYVDRRTLGMAFPDVVGTAGTPAGRAGLRSLGLAWSGERGSRLRFTMQTAFLRRAVGGSSWADLNLVAFVNYVLAAPGVDTDLRLQGASAVGTVLKSAPPERIVVGALPAVELTCGSYRRWVPERGTLRALRQAFALDLSTPVFRPLVERERLPSRVLVLASPARPALLQAYRAELRRALRESAGRAVAVDVRPVTSPIAALPIVERAARRPPLAVVVAVGRQWPAVPGGIEQGMQLLLDTLAAAGQPTVISEVPVAGSDRWPEVNDAIGAAAEASGTPLSPVAALLPAAGWDGATLDETLYAHWAALNAQALVRVVEPSYFAPALLSTRSGFGYYQRSKTSVAVTGWAGEDVVRQVAAVANLGFAAAGAPEGAPAAAARSVYYRPPALLPALILADELGIPRAAVSASPPPADSDLAVVLP